MNQKMHLILVGFATILVIVFLGGKMFNSILEINLRAALDRGFTVQEEVENYKRNNGRYPTSVNVFNWSKGADYVKAREDDVSYYILIQVALSRDDLIYYSGPLYPKNGWYFRGMRWPLESGQ